MKDAEEERIEADYKAAKAKCDAMKGNAKRTSARRKPRRRRRSPRPSSTRRHNPSQRNQRKVAGRARPKRSTTSPRRNASLMKGNEKDACEKEAKAKHDQAKADIKKQYAARERQVARADRNFAAARPAARRSESMARGLWKGAISFGLVNVPVELFSAEKKLRRARPHHARQARPRAGGLQAVQQVHRRGRALDGDRQGLRVHGRPLRACCRTRTSAAPRSGRARPSRSTAFVELGAIRPQCFETP